MPSWFTADLMKDLMWINCWWYLLLAVGFALTRTWVLVLYWLSAAGITLAAVLLAKGV